MEENFKRLKNFFEGSSACRDALKPLKKGVEIGMILDESLDCAIGKLGVEVFCEPRKATKPDVLFKVSSEAIDPILQTEDDIGKIGITIIKQVKAGNVSISIPGNIFSLLRNGYIEIIMLGGKTIWSFLSDHGITNPAKLTSLIRKMKSKS